MSLNGKSVKFQGVALHQDYHALGTAAPQRAMQRRLAELKALGVNAIRTAHDPPSPAFTVTATAGGLPQATTILNGTTAPFVPCTGTCN